MPPTEVATEDDLSRQRTRDVTGYSEGVPTSTVPVEMEHGTSFTRTDPDGSDSVGEESKSPGPPS